MPCTHPGRLTGPFPSFGIGSTDSSNVVKKFTPWKLEEIHVFNNMDSVCVIARK